MMRGGPFVLIAFSFVICWRWIVCFLVVMGSFVLVANFVHNTLEVFICFSV